jgi:hypothetical protein
MGVMGGEARMSRVRALATHEIVRLVHPRPITEKDELGLASGKAIDGALSQASYEFSRHRKPTAAAMVRIASEILDRELEDAAAPLPAEQRADVLTRIGEVFREFRKSELYGLPRPKTRMIVINEEAGIYAQPDFWDGRSRFYEMKSYRADPIPPDVELQLKLFQLAFPGVVAILACFDRHAAPVVSTLTIIPPLGETEMIALLRLAHRLALEHGTEKVLDYAGQPVIRYPLPP